MHFSCRQTSKYVNVYPKFAFSFRLNSEHRRAQNHERVALVYFSAQLTMIFHPITTMSCIKLIWLSPLLIPFFFLFVDFNFFSRISTLKIQQRSSATQDFYFWWWYARLMHKCGSMLLEEILCFSGKIYAACL